MPRQLVAVVVQDQAALGRVMVDVLKAEGYEVLTAESEESAAEITTGREVDLIVSDVATRSATPGLLAELVEGAPALALIEVRNEPAAMVPFFGPWRTEGRRLTLRRPYRLSDFLDAVRAVADGQKSA